MRPSSSVSELVVYRAHERRNRRYRALSASIASSNRSGDAAGAAPSSRGIAASSSWRNCCGPSVRVTRNTLPSIASGAGRRVISVVRRTLSRTTGRRERSEAQIAIGADREHVAERGLELELDDHVDRMRVRVEHADALAEAVREKARAADREGVGRVPCRSEDGAFGMHELEGGDVVLLGVR